MGFSLTAIGNVFNFLFIRLPELTKHYTHGLWHNPTFSA
jgi:hypothetical protein